jgi:glutathione-regulated potassium-efflux system ancillary protein KefF
MITLVYAHPYPDRSRANRTLLSKVHDLPGVEVRDLYRLYPDFSIDVEDEQEALLRSDTIVWQGPMYWYSVPALLKLWFEKVLSMGWAYGEGGKALHGKSCLWALTTGAPDNAFQRDGFHAFTFEEFVPVIQQTAQFCGMKWLAPFVLHGAHRVTDEELSQYALDYRERLSGLLEKNKE